MFPITLRYMSYKWTVYGLFYAQQITTVMNFSLSCLSQVPPHTLASKLMKNSAAG